MTATSSNQWVDSSNKSNPEAINKAKRILKSVIYCSLSTCSQDAFPWVSPVFYAYDDKLNLYWSSAIDALHSQNINRNYGRLAIAIYNSAAEEGTGEGLYLNGGAFPLKLKEAASAFEILQQRAGKILDRTAEDYVGDSPRRIYKFTPAEIWVTGERFPVGRQLVDTKIQIDINAIIDSL